MGDVRASASLPALYFNYRFRYMITRELFEFQLSTVRLQVGLEVVL